jgi:DNA-binding response OmpR family regulator
MKLLVIENESALLARITRHFRKEHFFCDVATGYLHALQKIESYRYDCIILDPALPDGDGLTLIKRLREDEWRSGVIVVSERSLPEDKIAALNSGADDYMTKPFHLPELSARVRALVRRKYNQGSGIIEVNALRIELNSHTVSCGGEALDLSKTEYNLFLYLVMNRNHIVPLQSIVEHLFDGPSEKAPGPNYVYGHIKNLKRKLKGTGCPAVIRAVYGVGYRLQV